MLKAETLSDAVEHTMDTFIKLIAFLFVWFDLADLSLIDSVVYLRSLHQQDMRC